MSRAKLNVNGRRQGALERRKADVEKYEAKLKTLKQNKEPDMDNLTYVLNKLKAALLDVQALEAKVRK